MVEEWRVSVVNEKMGFCSLALVAGENWCFCNSYQAHDNGAAANLNSSLLLPKFFSHNVVTSFRSNRIMRRSNKVLSVHASKAKTSSNYNLNIAHLIGRRKEGYVVPSYKQKSWKNYPIHEFLSHPYGIEATLKSDAAQSFQPLGSNIYRLTSPTIQFLNYEIIPVFDMRVITTNKDCTFEMLSCKFEGSEDVKSNKSRFSAFMKNHITWDIHSSNESKPRLDVEMTLGISFEVSGLPFSLLPLSVVETPGNLLIQAQVDNHARQVLQHLLLHYDKWVLEQCQVSL